MYTVDSFFAGVGGIDLGFEQTKQFKTIYANEFDSSAVKTYSLNFPNVYIDTRDIYNVSANDIPSADIFVGGFPCQAFSIAGYQQGFNDKKGRGELFFELLRIINIKKPRMVFLENVKNLVSHNKGNTFKIICSHLNQLGYTVNFKILNALEYGNLPQNRERVYILAFRDPMDYNSFCWPQPIPLIKTVKDVINFNNKVDDKYYYYLNRYKGDIYEKLVNAMADENLESPSIYQWRRTYVRKNQKGVIPTLTANQGEGGHNVCIIKTKYGIRKMTPRECFNAQGFPNDFILPIGQCDSRLYKQAGNSVCVPVIYRIALSIIKAFKLADKNDKQKYKI